MYENDSPGWAFLRILFFGCMWFGAYHKGKTDTLREMKDKDLEDQITVLRRKLAEQNYLNSVYRNKT